MRSLWRKELRSLAPFIALVIFFAGLNFVFVLLAEYPDQYSLSQLLSDEARTDTQVMIFILAFALALGLVVREQDEGTLAFLDALPVSRTQVFLSKFTLALGVLWLLPLCDLAFNATFHALSRTSLERGSRWGVLLTATLLDGSLCFIYLALGMALSFLRRFSFLVLGLMMWTYLVLQELQVPFVSLFNVFSLGDPVFQGQRWLIPKTKLAVQLSVGIVSLLIAFAAFQFMGDRAQRLATAVKRWRGSGWIGGLSTAVIVLVWIGLAGYFAMKFDLTGGPRATYETWATARATTARYQFLYPENQTGLANQLIDRADGVDTKVREFLDAAPTSQIVVDLADRLPRHAGQAYWKKIRMSLYASGDPELLPSVLGHETAHIYIDQLSKSRLFDDFNSTRFFHEGLASYVEYRLFLPAEKLGSLRQVGAVMRARDEVKIEELLDDAQLTLKRDRDLVYPLGEMFVAALVKRYGDNAPGKVVKSFARDNAPKNLTGFALWQDAFQASGYNFSDVAEAFFAELDQAVADHRPFIDSLPRLRGAVEREAGRIGIRPLFDGEKPGQIVCRFRPRGDTPDRFYERAFAEDGDVFWVNAADFTERSFWYQLGWRVKGAELEIYEPWVEVSRGR